VTIAEIDLRVVGTWRYLMTANGGLEVGFHGEYREIVPEERIAYTEVFEGIPDAGGTLNTATFSEVDGHTMLTLLSLCPSREVRDGIIDAGMEGGMQEQTDAPEQVASSLG
jgi:uncharacterized protein YndB with AHSA1/START domain